MQKKENEKFQHLLEMNQKTERIKETAKENAEMGQ